MLDRVLASVKAGIPPIHREGYPFIASFAVVAFLASWLVSTALGVALFGLTAWCVAFFRDPERVTPLSDGLVIAPADGRVSFVGPAVPPPELGLSTTPLTRVSIFMSVFDCHVNRAPLSGRIVTLAYKPGLFLNADLDKASEDNERSGIVIETASGVRWGVVQIAGLVARRIVSFVKEGHVVSAGERFGLIRFGSRVDVYFPEGVVPLVALGQRTVAGETILADTTRPGEDRPTRTS